MKIHQVFESEAMPFDWNDDDCLQNKVLAYFTKTHDAYFKWYPNGDPTAPPHLKARFAQFTKDLNAWLVKNGMVMEDTKDFFVLIHVER